MSGDSAQVQVGTLLPGATRVEEGVCDTWLGTVRLSTSGDRRAFVKLLSPRQVLSEIVASMLARHSELPVPKPLLVNVTREALPEAASWREGDQRCIAFGSEDIGQPSFVRFAKQGETALAKLRDWEHVRQTGAFDEWIANGDRHPGNFLFDGIGFWLIDHSHAFTGAGWSPSKLVPNVIVKNQVLDFLAPKGEGDETRSWIEDANRSCMKFGRAPLNDLAEASMAAAFSGESDAEAIAGFLRDRLEHVVPLICARLGIPRLNL